MKFTASLVVSSIGALGVVVAFLMPAHWKRADDSLGFFSQCDSSGCEELKESVTGNVKYRGALAMALFAIVLSLPVVVGDAMESKAIQPVLGATMLLFAGGLAVGAEPLLLYVKRSTNMKNLIKNMGVAAWVGAVSGILLIVGAILKYTGV